MNTKAYKRNLNGLKHLYDRGRFFICTAEGGHISTDEAEDKAIEAFLRNDKCRFYKKDCFKTMVNQPVETEVDDFEFLIPSRFLGCDVIPKPKKGLFGYRRM